jgi:ribonuclease VapC
LLAPFHKKTIERGGSLDVAQAFIKNVSLGIIPFDEEQAAASAALYPQAKEFGMSFADRACLALGIHLGAEVLSTEQKMGLLQLPVKVLLIRGRH